MTGAVCAAEDLAVSFNTMPDNSAIAVCAARCECVDRAFERIERAAASALLEGEALVVVVAADITGGHGAPRAVEGTCSVYSAGVGGRECTVSRGCRTFASSRVGRGPSYSSLPGSALPPRDAPPPQGNAVRSASATSEDASCCNRSRGNCRRWEDTRSTSSCGRILPWPHHWPWLASATPWM